MNIYNSSKQYRNLLRQVGNHCDKLFKQIQSLKLQLQRLLQHKFGLLSKFTVFLYLVLKFNTVVKTHQELI